MPTLLRLSCRLVVATTGAWAETRRRPPSSPCFWAMTLMDVLEKCQEQCGAARARRRRCALACPRCRRSTATPPTATAPPPLPLRGTSLNSACRGPRSRCPSATRCSTPSWPSRSTTLPHALKWQTILQPRCARFSAISFLDTRESSSTATGIPRSGMRRRRAGACPSSPIRSTPSARLKTHPPACCMRDTAFSRRPSSTPVMRCCSSSTRSRLCWRGAWWPTWCAGRLHQPALVSLQDGRQHRCGARLGA